MATSSKLPAGHPTMRLTQEFAYPPVPLGNPGDSGQAAAPDAANYPWSAPAGAGAAAEATQNEQNQRQNWQRGFDEGSARSRAEYEKGLAAQREEIGKALTDFGTQRANYFQNVEEQVVRLALAIARKILHREAQMDPLLLAGVVHVALEKIGAGASTRLRANPVDLAVWRAYFAQSSENLSTPELIGDPELKPGRCVLETNMGSTEISLETQLQEIEQGFFDLLAQRPGALRETTGTR